MDSLLKTNHRHKIFGSIPDYKELTIFYKMKFCIATRTLDNIFICINIKKPGMPGFFMN